MSLDRAALSFASVQRWFRDNGLLTCGLLLIWIYATYAHLFFGEYEAEIALRGFSALDFTNTILFPENFLRDYPGGAGSTGKSLLTWVYPLFASFGVPAETTLIGMVGLEIFVVIFGAAHLMHTLFKNLPPLSLLALSALIALSWIRISNLANFGNPFFHGQFYGFADGLRLLAISYYLTGRYKLSSSMLLIGFTIHPIKTVLGLVFIGAMHIAKCFNIGEMRAIWPYSLFLLFAGFWTWYWLGLGSADVRMTPQNFFRYSPLLNYHWYPQNLGIIDAQHSKFMTPFLSSVIVSIAILLRSDLSAEIKDKLFFGLAAIFMVSIAGLVVSWFELSVTLIKVSLQRASILSLSLATILLTVQTVRDAYDENWWFAILGLGLIAVAFFTTAVWPFVIVSVYLVSSLHMKKSVNKQQLLWYAGLLSLILVLVYEVYLLFLGHQEIRFWKKQIELLLVLVIFYQLIRFLLRKFNPDLEVRGRKFLKPVAIIFILLAMTGWGEKNRRLDASYLEQANAYKEVQFWARQNTSNTALFMIDPCQGYGWRDFSARSSFGSIHEWYKSGWLYSGDRAALHDGIRRGERLGINMDILASAGQRSPAWKNQTYLCTIAREKYYLATGEVIREIASDYNVQYAVLDKIQAESYGGIPLWSAPFENQRYVVLVPPQR